MYFIKRCSRFTQCPSSSTFYGLPIISHECLMKYLRALSEVLQTNKQITLVVKEHHEYAILSTDELTRLFFWQIILKKCVVLILEKSVM